MDNNSGILLVDGYEPHQTHRVITTADAGRFRVAIVEEPPQRRLLHYGAEAEEGDGDDRTEDVIDIPLPWSYTYLKFALGDHGWGLWQSALFFSPVKITKPLEQAVYAPYIPNCNTTGEVCWGDAYDPSMPDDLGASVRRALLNFWMLQFNDEVNPLGSRYGFGEDKIPVPYAQALAMKFGCVGEHVHLSQFLARVGEHSVEEVLDVVLNPGLGFRIHEKFWLPGYHTAHSGPLDQVGTYLADVVDGDGDYHDDYGDDEDGG